MPGQEKADVANMLERRSDRVIGQEPVDPGECSGASFRQGSVMVLI